MASEITHTGRLIEVTGSHLAVFEFESGSWVLDIPKSELPDGALEAGRLEVTFRVPEVKE